MNTKSLSLNNIQDILSYLGKECYQDKENNTRVRFIPGIFDDSIGHLFDDIVKDAEENILSRDAMVIHLWEIVRPNSTCRIHYSICNGIEDPNYEIDYYFNTTTSARVFENTNTFGGDNYIFYSNTKRSNKRVKM